MSVIRLRQVSKCYLVHDSPVRAVLGIVAPKMLVPKEIWALREIDLEVERGECVGIVGDNGSGKSTLLRVVAKIVTPTSGALQVDGCVSTLLDLTVGQQPQLSGRANIEVIGDLLGLTRTEIVERREDIIDFAGLGDAIDRPVKTYSAGMAMRLGFAIALHVDFDVLVVDEVLAVGDANFHRKCVGRMRELRQQRRTILFASHGLGDIAALTDRLVLLEHGRIAKIGPTEEVLAAYWRECERLRNVIGRRVRPLQPVNPYGDDSGQIRIERVSFRDAAGNERQEVRTGEPLSVEIWFEAARPVQNPLFRVQIFRNDGVWVHGMNTYRHGCDLGVVEGRGCIVLDYGQINLLEADYRVTVGVWPDEYRSFISDVAFDVHEMSYVLQVRSAREDGAGIVMQPARWRFFAPGSADEEALRTSREPALAKADAGAAR
jgi:ABC-type polysaccharide/polyol phosphate transport system ATPase subunit